MTSHLDTTSSSESSSFIKGQGVVQTATAFPLPPNTQVTQTTQSPPILPLSIISPDNIIPHEPRSGQIGRKFPWGFADPYNIDHCDFVRLKEAVFLEWRGELREASRERWYEGWRTSRLNHSPSAARGRQNTQFPPQQQRMLHPHAQQSHAVPYAEAVGIAR